MIFILKVFAIYMGQDMTKGTYVCAKNLAYVASAKYYLLRASILTNIWH